MNRQEFITAVLVAICVLALIAMPVACTFSDNKAIEEMVKAGAHPMDARCAVHTQTGETLCLARALNKQQEPKQ